eukprot:NODE_553_length_1374_cov_99.548516_g517_i0.p1 GENE.NODE_553_length_1374_cov_99.548516_g517_i0~~NODE_553_length_1374_cov_99.548516_g517_i0.p1  ORF type:complete len:246 (+),score=64.93 NODE_553_length_1374_cov_99.548516_g517_i0:78-740(+)
MAGLKDVYIAAVGRTPIGGLNGSLASFTAPQLGSIAIKGVLERANIDAKLVDEVFMGNVLQAGVGQAPARQAALAAGLPQSVVCTTINKVCASGTKSIILGAQAIMLGNADVVVAGGMESMTNTPYYLPKARNGYRYGNGEILDGLVKDGLFDVYNEFLMGNAAEIIASDMQISRQEQDDFAISSYTRAQTAAKNGAFSFEMIPVTVKGTRGKPDTVVTR